MEGGEQARLHRRLIDSLRLRTDPVALRTASTAELASNDVRTLRTTCLCQMIAMSRHERADGIVAASAEGNRCLWSDSCLGMVREPERLASGLLNRQFTRDEQAGKLLQDSIFSLDRELLIGGVMTAPLDLAPFEPEVVILYVTPGQALKLILGLSYAEGEVMNNPITGQAAVCQSVARAIATQRMVLEIPCVGDRTYGVVQDDELVVVIPWTRLAQIVDGMASTDAFASYPFRPFLKWPALFPPEFEPTRTELERD